QKPNALTN
ncbi:hypothetical protein D047_3926B, partial [Vibrio parahaemolyticus VPTS-2010_2]